MLSSTTSSSFPDLNVWLALLTPDHAGHERAREWWNRDQSEAIVFCRQTQLGLLRLLTTPAVMGGKPLTMSQAWAAHDRLHADARVSLWGEPPGLEAALRRQTGLLRAEPKLWADAYLMAFAVASGLTLVTFDKPLAARTGNGVVLL